MIIQDAFQITGRGWAVVSDVAWPEDFVGSLGATDCYQIEVLGKQMRIFKVTSFELCLKSGTEYFSVLVHSDDTDDFSELVGCNFQLLKK